MTSYQISEGNAVAIVTALFVASFLANLFLLALVFTLVFA